MSDFNINESAEAFNEEENKSSNIFVTILKWIGVLIIVLICALLFYRCVTSIDHPVVKKVLMNEAFLSAYNEKTENVRVQQYGMQSAWVSIDEGRIIEFNHLHHIPATNQLQFSIKYNHDIAKGATTSRQLKVSDNLEVILSDTVGFIAKLPHHLVDAFRATLEELEYADLLLHVIDSADPNREEHIQVVDKLIAKLAKPDTKTLRCYNKADLVSPQEIPIGEDVVRISAKQGYGMDHLLTAIEKTIGHSRHHIIVTLPYSMGGMLDTLHSGAQVLHVDYTGEGIVVETVVDPILYGKLQQYITKEC